MVTEQVIYSAAAELDQFEQEVKQFEKGQPAAYAYLFTSALDVLTVEEREYLLYLAIVIRKAILQERKALPTLTEEQIGEREEANYGLLPEGGGRFRDKLTPFFEQSKEEDLLAFVEDALEIDTEDEDEFSVTPEGREPIFLTLKTLIDCWT